MKSKILAAALLPVFATAAAADSWRSPFDPNVQDLTVPGPPILGPHYTREMQGARIAPLKGAARTNALMTYHNGKILPSSNVAFIFWGQSWTAANDVVMNADVFGAAIGGSNYAKTWGEYKDRTGAAASAIVNYKGHVIDTSPVTSGAGGSPGIVQAEVCKYYNASLNPNSFYYVISDQPRNGAGYCGWHSYGVCGGQIVQFGFSFNLAGDNGCNPLDDQTGHSQAVAATYNVFAHELAEGSTDPIAESAASGGWFDSAGGENGDKCAWTFNVPYVTLTDGSKWKLQGEWSNAAFNAGTGYPNSSGQKGCLDGH